MPDLEQLIKFYKSKNGESLNVIRENLSSSKDIKYITQVPIKHTNPIKIKDVKREDDYPEINLILRYKIHDTEEGETIGITAERGENTPTIPFFKTKVNNYTDKNDEVKLGTVNNNGLEDFNVGLYYEDEDYNIEKLDLEEYRKLTRKTATYPEDEAFEYLTYGLMGEQSELSSKVINSVDSNYPTEGIIKELGDVLWYITVIVDNQDYKVEDFYDKDKVSPPKESLNELLLKLNANCGKFAELTKKKKRDGKEINIEGKVTPIYKLIDQIATLHSYSIEEVANLNMQKLLDRKERNKIKGDGDNR